MRKEQEQDKIEFDFTRTVRFDDQIINHSTGKVVSCGEFLDELCGQDYRNIGTHMYNIRYIFDIIERRKRLNSQVRKLLGGN